MTAQSQQTSAEQWTELILGAGDPGKVWSSVFGCLKSLALSDLSASALHKETVLPDRLLAESAWSLWQEFPQHAPSVIAELKQFWRSSTSSGTAVLILDGLSLRELPHIIKAAQERGVPIERVEVRAAEVPTETNRFAEALGLTNRAKLQNNQAPDTFIFSGPDVYTEVLDAPFADCVGSVPTSPRLFLWHTWPDEPLIHGNEDKEDGPQRVAVETKNQLASGGFWEFVNRMRQGRRLVITGDHGYAASKSFSTEIRDDESKNLLRQTFGAKRCAREDPSNRWPSRHLPPLICRHAGWLVVVGQRKWPVQGGFPKLCHRGLTLLEATVSYIEFPPS